MTIIYMAHICKPCMHTVLNDKYPPIPHKAKGNFVLHVTFTMLMLYSLFFPNNHGVGFFSKLRESLLCSKYPVCHISSES